MKFSKEVVYHMGMIMQLGISMLAPIILCVFIGYWLDGKFGWYTTMPLLLLGILAGARNTWLLLKQIQNKGKKGKDIDEKSEKHK